MKRIEEAFRKLPEGKRFIITTEKDAARLIAHPLLSETMKPYIYVLPVEVEFLIKKNIYLTKILSSMLEKIQETAAFLKARMHIIPRQPSF